MIRYIFRKAYALYYFEIAVITIFSFYMIFMFSSIIYDLDLSKAIIGNLYIDEEQVSRNIISNSLPQVAYGSTEKLYNRLVQNEFEKRQDTDEEEYEYEINKLGDIEITNMEGSEKEIMEAYKNNNIQMLDKIISSLYIFEKNVLMNSDTLKLNELISKDTRVNVKDNKPRILIFHTHSQEAFCDSRTDNENDSVIGIGEELAKILKTKYKVNVIHNKSKYDVKDGKLDRNGSYARMTEGIKEIIKNNPQIEVLIDIHRDGIPDNMKLLTNINNKPTAKIMFVNGLCEKLENGKMEKISTLPNKYVEDNMAFSLQMQLVANRLYEGFARKILLKPYRYSLHMKPKSLLVEVGAQTNTVDEAKNAMEPLADILMEVLKK